MVQNKQKSNKTNIIALLSSFLVAFVFVFGCVEYAHAEITDAYVYGEDSYKYINDSRSHFVAFCRRNMDRYDTIFLTNFYGRVAALRETENVNGSMHYVFRLYTKSSNNDVSIMVYNTCSYPKDGKYKSSLASFSGPFDSDISGYSTSYKIDDGELIYSGICIFDNSENLNNYLDTGEINNAIYQPSSYDENVPTPKNLEVYFDRKLNKPFNLSELCNLLKIKWTIPEDSDYSEYTLDVQIDVNYNKLNSIGGIGTKPTILQTGKVEFALCSATDKELNISSTYGGWTELSKKYQNSTWGLTGNYFDLWLRYKDSSGNYGNWVKVTINPDNSSTVVKAGLFDNGTNTTINKGYEEISGDSGEHVKGDYDNYYVDTVGDDVSNNLTSLKNNYSNLVSFFKELFGFLPTEIWVLLIGLVSTMVIIAVVMFVRG